MIPSDWEPHHRSDDGELVGFIAGEGDASIPMNLLGQALDEPMDRFAAAQTLEDLGLGYLAERWVLTYDDGAEDLVVLVEIDAERVVVAGAQFALVVNPGDLAATHELEVPTDRLRRA